MFSLWPGQQPSLSPYWKVRPSRKPRGNGLLLLIVFLFELAGWPNCCPAAASCWCPAAASSSSCCQEYPGHKTLLYSIHWSYLTSPAGAKATCGSRSRGGWFIFLFVKAPSALYWQAAKARPVTTSQGGLTPKFPPSLVPPGSPVAKAIQTVRSPALLPPWNGPIKAAKPMRPGAPYPCHPCYLQDIHVHGPCHLQAQGHQVYQVNLPCHQVDLPAQPAMKATASEPSGPSRPSSGAKAPVTPPKGPPPPKSAATAAARWRPRETQGWANRWVLLAGTILRNDLGAARRHIAQWRPYAPQLSRHLQACARDGWDHEFTAP